MSHGRTGALASRLIPALGLFVVLLASCEDVSVTAVEVARVEISPEQTTVGVQGSTRLDADVLGTNGEQLSGRSVSWSSLDPDIASVDDAGLVEGLAPGVARIRASSEGASGTATVTVTTGPVLSLTPTTVDFTAVQQGASPGDRFVSIANAGDGSIADLSASVRYPDGGGDWLTALVTGATAPASLQLSVSHGDMAPGTYAAVVDVTSPDAANSPQSVEVTLVVLTPQPAIALGATSISFVAVESGSAPSPQSTGVTNAGGGTLDELTATVQYANGSPSGWLEAELAASTAPTSLVLTTTTAELPAGTYAATVRISSAVAQNSPQTVSVSLRVGAAVPVLSVEPDRLDFTGRAGGADPAGQVLQVTNDGGGTLSGLAVSIAYPGGQAGGWLRTDLSGTTAPASVTVSPVTGSLAPGTYSATVQIASSSAGNSPQSVPVSFTVLEAEAAIRVTPGSVDFSATVTGGNPAPAQVEIVNGGGGALGVVAAEVAYAAGEPTGWLNAELEGTAAPTTLVLDAVKGGLAEGTYSATVRITATGAANSPVDIPVTFTIAQTAPSSPSALGATARSDRRVDLVWNDNSSTESEFRIERSTNGGASWSALAVTAANQTSWSDDDLAGSTSYTYRVSACNAAGCSAPSGTTSATTAPDAPSQLTATAESASRVEIRWNDNSSDESAFLVERSTDAQNWAQIHTAAAGATSFEDTGRSPSTTYHYRVRACRGDLCSNFSAAASATTDQLPPGAPGSLSATAISTSRIDLAWNAPSGTVDEYRIERKTGAGGSYSRIATLGSNVLSYEDSGLASSTQYVYRVLACNTGGCSNFSSEAEATTMTPPPGTPADVSATATSTSEIELSWSAASGTVSEYRIERKTGAGGSYSQVATLGDEVLSYEDSGLASSTQYVYRVRACNAGGCSAFSAEASATTQTPLPDAPGAPSNLAASAVSTSQIDLSWAAASGTVDEYQLERKTGEAGTWALLQTLDDTDLSHQDAGLDSSTEYVYRIRACNAGGCSAYSAEASATTQTPLPDAPGAPSNLAASAVSSSQIDLSWAAATGTVDEYQLERKTGEDGTWALLRTLDDAVLSYQDTGLESSTEYVYRIRACNTGGCSAYSAEAAATTQTPLPVAPASPSSLSASAVSASTIDLEWQHDGSLATHFQLERAPGSDPDAFTALATVPSSERTYSDTDLPGETTFHYRVSACNSVGCSTPSGSAAATTQTATSISTPSQVVAAPLSATEIELNWSPPGGQTQYQIRRRDGTAGPWTFSNVADGEAVDYRDSGLSPATTYQYQVQACTTDACSEYSAPATVSTLSAEEADPAR